MTNKSTEEIMKKEQLLRAQQQLLDLQQKKIEIELKQAKARLMQQENSSLLTDSVRLKNYNITLYYMSQIFR